MKKTYSNPLIHMEVFSAEEIYSRVWVQDAYAVENTVMVHISRIREKLELDPANPEYIRTKWGVGYYLARTSGE